MLSSDPKGEAQYHVSAESTVEKLLPFLNCVPLQSIKDLINDHIQAASDGTMRSIYMRTSSIQATLSEDTIQWILKFIPYQDSVRFVSKEFKKLADRNKAILQRDSEHIIHVIKAIRWEMCAIESKRCQLDKQYNDLLKNKEKEINALLLRQHRCTACLQNISGSESFQCCKCPRVVCSTCVVSCAGASEWDECDRKACNEFEFFWTDCSKSVCDECKDRHLANCWCGQPYEFR